jgi:uncharacterized protein YfaA (DUF2138 family)
MKFWQLLSIFRDEHELLTEVLKKDKWVYYQKNYKTLENIINQQQRDILDCEVDNELLEEIVSKSKKVIYWSLSDGKIYSYKNISTTKEIQISKAISLFPHDSIEEVFEKSESSVP